VKKPLILHERIEQVEQRIMDACHRTGRNREDVQLVAVTKYVSLQTTRTALDLGLEHIGESRWQDAKEKWEALGHRGIWHFIGHLQTNKVRDVLGRFHWIHSLDRVSLAKEIQKRAEGEGIKVPCLIQVNISGEQSKYGLAPEQLVDFVKQIMPMRNIELKGLMTMAPYEDQPELTRHVFRELREWKDRLNDSFGAELTLEHLSMGMSNDFEIAIEEGATMVRLGSILVGREIKE
jgi:pyridoxal phosphate enzyme (YggS family)